MKKKLLVSTVLVSVISFMSVSPAFAATAVDSDVIKENISVDNENWTQGMVEEQWTATHSSPLFPSLYLSIGKHVRYPAEGGGGRTAGGYHGESAPDAFGWHPPILPRSHRPFLHGVRDNPPSFRVGKNHS